MSQFASGQGAQLASLGALARTAGEGQRFLTRFQMEQQALGTALRAAQQQQQAEGARADRGIQLQKLAAEQESRRFTQALEAQRAEQQAAQQIEQQSIADRERAIATKFRERELDRLESQLNVSERRVAVEEDRAQLARIAQEQPKDIGKELGFVLDQLKEIQQIKERGVTSMSDQQILELNRLEGDLVNRAGSIRQAMTDAAKANAENAETLQKFQPVNKTKAGPKLAAALNEAGQSEPDDLPLNEQGGLDLENLKTGRIYFIPGEGPQVWTGRQFIEISELEGLDDTAPSQPQAAPASDLLSRGPTFGAF